MVALGTLLQRPITRVPENTLKRVVGATLAGLGIFWVGDGARLHWPGDDAAIVPLSFLYFMLSVSEVARLPQTNGASVQ